MAKSKKRRANASRAAAPPPSKNDPTIPTRPNKTALLFAGTMLFLAVMCLAIFAALKPKATLAPDTTFTSNPTPNPAPITSPVSPAPVAAPAAAATPVRVSVDGPLRDFKVINAHEHLMGRKYLDKYLEAAARTGVVRTLFVASSNFTLRGNTGKPTEGNEDNSNEMLEVAEEFPGKIIPFVTFHPSDPAKLDKLKDYVARGARGLKLYTGHGNFWDRPLDCEEMLPVYAYCEQMRLPICWHVNLTRYAGEFNRVMARFPNLIVIVPHFGVTFYRPTEKPWRDFQAMLDTYPNLYTDTSFGTRNILVAGLETVSRQPEIFRAFLDKYCDRTLWGTDMVITGNKEKTTAWIEDVLRACRDCLEKETYHYSLAAAGSPYAYAPANNVNGELRGLNLPDDMLRKIYETNFLKLFPEQ